LGIAEVVGYRACNLGDTFLLLVDFSVKERHVTPARQPYRS